MIYDCLIVGAGHAGVQAAFSLRQMQFKGSIGLLGEEADPPYERPPLSKDFLAGQRDFDSLLLRRTDAWADRGIDLLLGRRVTTVHPDGHEVELAGDGRFGYGTLIWAAGGKPRRLSCSGGDLAGIHTIRTRADVDALRDELCPAGAVAIIGGGYIGLEAAAVLSGLGKSVTVIEAQDRVLARVAGEPLSRFYEREHRARGVSIRLRASVQRVDGANGRVDGVRLADGTTIPADMVIAAIGIDPVDGPLRDAGAESGNGVRVDGFCRTSIPDVFAIGDCVMQANPFAANRQIRVESVQNANDQAVHVAKMLTGNVVPYRALPWFWSNQYDLRLQTVGISAGHDSWVVRGDPDSRSFSVVYLLDGRISALDCVNATRDFVQGRGLIGRTAPAPVLTALGDPAVPLKEITSALDA